MKAVSRSKKRPANLKRKRKLNWKRLTRIVGVITLISTFYALILPAITMETGTYCGQEAHVHSADCYQEREALTCGLVEGEGHVHDDSCYEVQDVLICDDPDHDHDENCYDTQYVPICGLAEQEGHTHTADCWKNESVQICSLLEHSHSEQCHSNPEADLETYEDWQKSVEKAELTDDRSENLLAIAKTQIGTKESENNFSYDKEAGKANGLSRYGLWKGEPYDPWNLTFIDFCLEFAHIDPAFMLEAKDYDEWMEKEAETEWLNSYDTYFLGGLAFFKDKASDKIYGGIIEEVSDDEKQLKLIVADYKDSVKEVDLDLEEDEVLGTWLLPPEEFDPSEYEVMPLESNLDSISINITTNDVTYVPEENILKVKFDMSFDIDQDKVTDGKYVITLSDSLVPDGLVDGKKRNFTMGDGKTGGTFEFVQNSDGKYQLIIDIDDQIIKDHQETHTAIHGKLQFDGISDQLQKDDNGNIKVEFTDGVHIDVPGDEINHPPGQTIDHDIYTHKDGEIVIDSNKSELVYKVKVWSKKGTPDPIQLTDILTPDKALTLGNIGSPTVTVNKVTRNGNENGDVLSSQTLNNVKKNYDSSGKLTMELPALAEPNENQTSCYEIEYRYPIQNAADLENKEIQVNNKVNVEAKEGKTTLTAKAEVTKWKKFSSIPLVSKSGKKLSDDGEIEWTIEVNPDKINATGAVITDPLFNSLYPGQIKIDPAKGFDVIPNPDGTVKEIRLKDIDGKPNQQFYKITYKTKTQISGWEEETVTNKATVEKDGKTTEDTGEVKLGGGSLSKSVHDYTVSGNTVITDWTTTVSFPYGIDETLNIDDIFRQNEYSLDQWMSKEQAQMFADKGITAVRKDGRTEILSVRDIIKFTDVKGNTYTFDQLKNETKVTRFTAAIDPNRLTEYNQLILNYSTTTEIPDNQKDIWITNNRVFDSFSLVPKNFYC